MTYNVFGGTLSLLLNQSQLTIMLCSLSRRCRSPAQGESTVARKGFFCAGRRYNVICSAPAAFRHSIIRKILLLTYLF